jgi:hypothetical protein
LLGDKLVDESLPGFPRSTLRSRFRRLSRADLKALATDADNGEPELVSPPFAGREEAEGEVHLRASSRALSARPSKTIDRPVLIGAISGCSRNRRRTVKTLVRSRSATSSMVR